MIIDAILTLLFGLLQGLLAMLPAWQLPGSIDAAAASALGNAASTANGFFPVDTLGLCLAALIGFEVAIQTVAICVWVWNLIPFKAS